MDKTEIESVLKEQRKFPPSLDFSKLSFIKSPEELSTLCEKARKDPESFWRECAEALDWHKPFEKVTNNSFENPRWFEGGQLNVSWNCVGRHCDKRGRDVAIIWEGEPETEAGDPEQRWITYRELNEKIQEMAAGLRAAGIQKGDRVAIYMPMAPEIIISMLACAHVGAVHSVIFAGFSPQAIFDRVQDAGAKLVITSDGLYRKGSFLPLFEKVDEALSLGDTQVEKVVVWNRHQEDPLAKGWIEARKNFKSGRDTSWNDFIRNGKGYSTDYEWLDSEDPLFILYTSGTTGKPKGIVHSQAGYLLWAQWTNQWVFDLNENDLFWCTADCGWITGHTYVTYGPLALGGKILIYEGAPFSPHPYRFWEIIERHHVTVFYTAPTAIRSFMTTEEEKIKKYDLSTLRLLGSVGEPINPEAWMWYHKNIGREKAPIVDTWWQTETGGIMLSPLPGATTTKPGSATFALPGIEADIVDGQGEPVPAEHGGLLVIKKPWPSQARTIWGDHDRFIKTYFKPTPGVYTAGDVSYRDKENYFWILGRADDVLNVSGHRIGTAEVESALVSHSDVVEAAVIGIPHDIKGQGIAAFVTLKKPDNPGEALVDDLKGHVAKMIGSMARPEMVKVVKALPKTRSGKIMRRLLRDVAIHGEIRGDTTTLEDKAALEVLF